MYGFDVKFKHLIDTYRFPGFKPLATVRGIFGDPKARVIRLVRRGKKLFVAYAESQSEVIMIIARSWSGIYRAETRKYSSNLNADAFIARIAGR